MFWYVMTTKSNSLVVGGLALMGWILAAAGWIRGGPERRRFFWVVLLPIVSLNLLCAALLGLGRYSAPTIPALMVLAAFGIDRLLLLVWRKSPSETPSVQASAVP
jgi:hypothetical protein